MDKDTREPEMEVAQDLEVLEEGQIVTDEVMACCQGGTGNARV